MIFILLVGIVVVAGSALLTVVALISVASKREDSEWSLGEPPRGLGRAVARRIVGFHSRGMPEWPRPYGLPAAQALSCSPSRAEFASSGHDELPKAQPWPK